jgi:triosephosphate isomerase
MFDGGERMARKPFVAGNWKMNLKREEARALVEGLKPLVKDLTNVQVLVCPVYTSIDVAVEAAKGSHIQVGAQNLQAVEKDGKLVHAGAYTGEVSAPMLAETGVSWVILGHSERRQYFNETDAKVSVKVRAAFEAGLLPIICVGETLEERDGGKTLEVLATQVKGCFANVTPEQARQCVIAYEPVWAIGTGRVATTEQAQEAHAFIRKQLASLYDSSVADAVRIQYGGSMNPANAADLLAQPDVDGGLIGGASLKADSFAEIVKAASKRA